MTATKNMTSEELFDFLSNDGMGGFEDLTIDTVSLPFLRIVQSLSPQLKRNKPEFIPTAEIGDIFNTTTRAVYGKSVRVVVGRFERVYLAWKPNRGGYAGRYTAEAVSSMLTVGDITNDNGRLYMADGCQLSETYSYAVLLPDHMDAGVCILSLASTQLKEAKKWNAQLLSAKLPDGRRALPHFMVWNLESIEQSNDKGDWFGIKVSFDSFVNQEVFAAVTDARKTAISTLDNVDYKALDSGTTIDISHESRQF